MKGIYINTTVYVTLSDDGEVFYKNYCMEKYNLPCVHARTQNGALEMLLHEAMTLSVAFSTNKSPFEMGMICFKEESVINVD